MWVLNHTTPYPASLVLSVFSRLYLTPTHKTPSNPLYTYIPALSTTLKPSLHLTHSPPATFKPALHLPFSPLKTLKPSPSLANRKSMPYPSIQTARNPVIPYILALQLPSNPVIPYLPALPISTLYL